MTHSCPIYTAVQLLFDCSYDALLPECFTYQFVSVFLAVLSQRIHLHFNNYSA